MMLKKTWPSMARHLYLDENGVQYLDSKPLFEEIKKVPKNIDHLEFRVRLLEARHSVMSARTISQASNIIAFLEDDPKSPQLDAAIDSSFQEFLASLESWNLTDEAGSSIPITEEAINQLPKWVYTLMSNAVWTINNPKN